MKELIYEERIENFRKFCISGLSGAWSEARNQQVFEECKPKGQKCYLKECESVIRNGAVAMLSNNKKKLNWLFQIYPKFY